MGTGRPALSCSGGADTIEAAAINESTMRLQSSEVSPAAAAATVDATSAQLRQFIDLHARLFILTGAGCSTASGIPDYRDAAGNWKGAAPIKHQAFINSAYHRQRYWARSMAGWPAMRRAEPNAAHRAIARLQERGRASALVTQNVDGLHLAAGSDRVIHLHGRMDRVLCLQCDTHFTRSYVQELLTDGNRDWVQDSVTVRPDGDMELGDVDYSRFSVPACPVCGGVLKPDVVFFGGAVPKPRVERARRRLQRSDAVLVVGSSLMVWSGMRFVRHAAELGLPIAIVNQGVTRADDLADLKLQGDCADLLAGAVDVAT